MTRARLSRKAQADLAQIWRYSQSRWSADQADIYLRTIARAIDRAGHEPQLGRTCAPAAPDYRRLAAGSHFVFYRIEEGGIVVVRILHQRMDFMRHL